MIKMAHTTRKCKKCALVYNNGYMHCPVCQGKGKKIRGQ